MSPYIPALQFKRTDAEKLDQHLSWNRTDAAFFASGACHILAFAFLETYSNLGFECIYLQPKNAMPGSHMYASNGIWSFDFNGWHKESILIESTIKAAEILFPEWSYTRLVIHETLEDFCTKYKHRLPEQFVHNPFPRAYDYMQTFSSSPKEEF